MLKKIYLITIIRDQCLLDMYRVVGQFGLRMLSPGHFDIGCFGLDVLAWYFFEVGYFGLVVFFSLVKVNS